MPQRCARPLVRMSMTAMILLGAHAHAAETNLELNARFACRQFIARHLHDPDSADFSQWTTAAVTRGEHGIFKVVMRIRAKNAFNALRIVRMQCILLRESGGWRGVSVRQLDK